MYRLHIIVHVNTLARRKGNKCRNRGQVQMSETSSTQPFEMRRLFVHLCCCCFLLGLCAGQAVHSKPGRKKAGATKPSLLQEGAPVLIRSAEGRYLTSTPPEVIATEYSGGVSQWWTPVSAGGKRLYLVAGNSSSLQGALVLALDSHTGNLTVEPHHTQTSSSQLWLPLPQTSGELLLRNYGNDQCVKNYDFKGDGLAKKIANFIQRLRGPYKPKPAPHPLSTLDCSGADASQRWSVERVET